MREPVTTTYSSASASLPFANCNGAVTNVTPIAIAGPQASDKIVLIAYSPVRN